MNGEIKQSALNAAGFVIGPSRERETRFNMYSGIWGFNTFLCYNQRRIYSISVWLPNIVKL